MTEILKKWLCMRLDMSFQWNPENFGNAIRDGVIISQLLESYNIITTDQKKSILCSNEIQWIRNNWTIIKEWLKDINIDLNSNDIESLVKATSSTALRLFYQMFLELDGKDRLYFIRKKYTQSVSCHKLGESAHMMSTESTNPIKQIFSKTNNFKFAADILKNRKLNEQTNTNEECKNSTSQENLKKSTCRELNYTYAQLKELEEKAKKNIKSGELVDKERVREYSKQIKAASKETKKSFSLVDDLENVILDKMIKQCKQKENEKKNAKIILNLSHYEKKMTKKLMLANHEMELVMKNRIKQQEEIDRLRQVEFSHALDDLKYQIKQKTKQVDFEKELLTLFKDRLHSEEVARNHCQTLEICKGALTAILSLVYKLSQFKQMSPNRELPEIYLDEWKTIFLNGNIDDIPTELEDIEQAEQEERSILDERDFLNYHYGTGSWSVDLMLKSEYYFECEESEAYRTLGCIIQKMCSSKNLVPKYEHPDPLPSKKFATILLNARDLSKSTFFLNLLTERNTLVIEMNQAIAFCLEEYKRELIEFDEMTPQFIVFEASLKGSINNQEHQINSSLNSESRVHSSSANKHTQTPIKLPLVDKYSIPSQLGKIAYENLNNGDCVSNELLTSIIVEFLRHNLSFDGWVFIDFPKNFIQAKLLEEKLTGQVIKTELENSEMSNIEQNEMACYSIDKGNSEKSIFFQSRIIPDPTKNSISEFDTYFTTFLKLKQSSCIAQEDCICKLTQENSTLMERFYADQGINYSLYFEMFDDETIELIVKYVTEEILKSKNISQKSISTANLGSTYVNSKIKLFKNQRYESVSSFSNYSVSSESFFSKNLSTDNPGSRSIPMNIENVSLHSNNILKPSNEQTSKTSEQIKKSDIQESQKVTACIELTIPASVLSELGSLWETCELTYVRNVKELLYTKRNLFAELIPYVTYLRQHLKYSIHASSSVNIIISSLQNELNSMDDKTRNSNIVKSDMYTKINEMQNELMHSVELKKIEYKKKTSQFIQDDWLTKNLTNLTNCFIMLIQVELNRSGETLKMISAYYDIHFGNNPSKDQLTMLSLLKLSSSATSMGLEGNATFDRDATESDITKNCVPNALINGTNISNDENIFLKFLDSTKVSVEVFITNLFQYYKTLIDKESSKLVKGARTKDDTNLKDKRFSKSDPLKEINNSEVIQEWDSIFNAEICRLRKRLDIIYLKAVEQVNQYKDFFFEVFLESNASSENISSQEIEKVISLYNLFNRAVETECNIPGMLDFESKDFEKHVETSWKLIDERDAIKFSKTCDFPIKELATLRNRLMCVAKNCSIPTRSFIIILQDFFILNWSYQCTIPNSTFDWNLLEPDDFEFIVKSVYGDINFVDWRDFLILCLDIPFPDQRQLLELRNDFIKFDLNKNETVTRENYYNVFLWFQPSEDCSNNHHILRSCLVKEFLFLLFEVSIDIMNYSAFLLAFCKMDNPEDGFVNSLSLILGKPVCQDIERCESFEKNWQKELNLKKAMHQEAVSNVDHLLDSIVDHTIRICSDVNISDIITPKPSLECFNKMFLGVKSASKQARRVKPQQSSRSSVVSQSTRISSSNSIKSKSRKSKSVSIFQSVNLSKASRKSSEVKVNFSEEIYCISEEKVKKVLLTSLPWNCRSEFLEPYRDIVVGLSHTFTELKYDNDYDDVFIHKLLDHQFIKTLLHTIHKFKLSKPCSIATQIILDKKYKF